VNAEAEGAAQATEFRRRHHLGVHPLGDLIAIIEQSTGIDVAVVDAEPDEHGLAIRDPRSGVVFIGIAQTPHPMRQRSTLAHELGHVLFEDWVDADTATLDRRSPAEVRADTFARHLLVPRDGLREMLGADPVTEAALSAVVQRFLVSAAMAAIALHDADYIDLETKEQWKTRTTPQLAARYGWSDHYRALQAESRQHRTPQRLLARAITGYAEGVVSAQTIATLRGVSAETVKEDLRDAGIVSASQDVVWADAAALPDVHVDLSELEADLDGPRSDDLGSDGDDRG
jgi:Zn-dependent peptidase ImmA (M78 family)